MPIRLREQAEADSGHRGVAPGGVEGEEQVLPLGGGQALLQELAQARQLGRGQQDEVQGLQMWVKSSAEGLRGSWHREESRPLHFGWVFESMSEGFPQRARVGQGRNRSGG
jgi:hypothetical protein